MAYSGYLMEHEQEAFRLDLKTDKETLEKQAFWAGLKPGMRVLDLGCGSGITTYFLHQLVQPHGQVVGLDSSEARIEYAHKQYGDINIKFICRDIFQSLEDLGTFDFIWVRFFLEYHRSKSFEIVKKITKNLKPGGILCLIDLDNNCLNIYGHSDRLHNSITGIIKYLESNFEFDPHAGIKLYSYLYDLNYQDIKVSVETHHLFYGQISSVDFYNWKLKAEIAVKKSGYHLKEYDGNFEKFLEEYKNFLTDPRLFIYTPMISCSGYKPLM